MHESIKRFPLRGIIKYEYLTQVKDTLERTVEEQMREQGYVPVLDMDVQLSQQMDDTGNFVVEMSVYGAYVGDKSWQLAGLMNGKPIPKYTPKLKLKQS